MKSLLILILFTISSIACSGSCIDCHEKLKESINTPHHRVLKSCVKCHLKKSNHTKGCGKSCFDCHSKKKLYNSNIAQHQAIKECLSCHIDTKELFDKIDDNTTNLSKFLFDNWCCDFIKKLLESGDENKIFTLYLP